ncbi:PD40 domain-containing protein [Pedobacter sp. R20-19]|uniref:PD40 domain-containing protein n=1 Tax=Pedobacter sp. R20-19 TaxID=1270196 RepID=UPI0004930C1C|nr:PD40 domain-containing protein [Pedobacter sp. R20-19]
MIKFNLHLAMVVVPSLILFSACNSGNNDQSKSTAVLDTVSLSNKRFALAYQDGDKIVATSIDTMKQISFGGANHPAISPDGNKLAYTVKDSVGNNSIWVADMESKSQLHLQVNSKNYDDAVWSPNGGTIAFNFLNDQKIWKVGIIKADNTGFLVLDSKSAIAVSSPVWKTETELMAHDLKNIYTFNLNGKLMETNSIADLLGAAYHISASDRFFYAQNGKILVFNSKYGKAITELNDMANAVFTLDLNSRKIKRISPEGMNTSAVFVTADDRIFYSGAENPYTQSKIYVSDLEGNVKLLVNKGMNPTATLK